MPVHSAADYIHSLILELDQVYEEYGKILCTAKNNLKKWNNTSLSHFRIVEKESMDRIRSYEKTLSAWLNDQESLRTRFSPEISLLAVRRKDIFQENRQMMEEIRCVMYTLKKEQNSLRLPRSNPRIKESVPTLIDIKL